MKLQRITNITLKIALIAFSLYISYQILRIIFGGSWIADATIIAMIAFNITKTNSNLKHLGRQFNSLATDFKSHLKESHKHTSDFSELKTDFRHLATDTKELKTDLRELRTDFKLHISKS